jgi:hypothetical protein
MLNRKTGGYPYAHFPQGEDPQSVYFPDAVIGPFIDAAKNSLPDFFRAQREEQFSHREMSARRFSLEESKALIIEAFSSYDPQLGDKAKEILKTAQYKNGDADLKAEESFRHVAHDDSDPHQGRGNPYLRSDYKLDIAEGQRWVISPVAPGQSSLMRCLPASSPQRDYGDGFYDPANPQPHAAIEYEFDGTIDAVVHMAHEMGHMIADDYGLDAGHTFQDNPVHMQETQAYLGQHILYAHLKRHSDASIAQVAYEHFTLTMTNNICSLMDRDRLHSRPLGLLSAMAVLDKVQDQDLFAKRHVSERMWGRMGPADINQVLASAGVERPDDMKKLAQIEVQKLHQHLQGLVKDVSAPTPSAVRRGQDFSAGLA